MKKIFTFLLGVLLCAPLLNSCNENTDRPLLGLALNNASNDWRKQLATYAAEAASAHSGEMDYMLQAATDAAKQTAQLEAMKEAGCDAIVIVPEGNLNLEVVNDLIKSGIAVFLCEEKANVNYTGFATVSNTEVGEKAGEWLAAQAGVTRVLCLDIAQNKTVSDARVKGFRSKLNSIESATIDCDVYSREAGKAVALELLTDAQYADVTAIYAQDDEVALGVLDALTETPGAPVVYVIGCGGSKAFFDAITASTTVKLATTLYTPAMIKTSVEQAAQWLLSGTTPSPKDAYLPVTVVDATNVATQTPF